MPTPTVPGHYWYKFGRKPWDIVYVDEHGGRLYVSPPDGPIYWLDEKDNGWTERITGWVGPLKPPESP